MSKVFCERLKELRADKKISMKDLAKAVGATDGAISNWENGINEPKLTFIARLALYFGVSSDYLLGLEDETGEKTRKDTDEGPKI